MPHAPRMTRRQREQLSALIATKRATDDRSARRRTSLEQALRVSNAAHFSPARHGLSPEECRLANALLRRAEQERPLQGDSQQVRFRHALRCAGIVSAVRRGAVGSRRFGRSLHAHRGGRVMALHGVHILREMAPLGNLASRIAHERRQAAAYYETTGEVLPIGTKPAASPEECRIQDMATLWEKQQWQIQQAERLRW